MVLVTGRVEVDDERAKMRATEIAELKTVAERFVKEVCVNLKVPPHGHDTFRALADVLLRYRGDKRVQFELRVRRDARRRRCSSRRIPQVRVRPSDDLVLKSSGSAARVGGVALSTEPCHVPTVDRDQGRHDAC